MNIPFLSKIFGLCKDTSAPPSKPVYLFADIKNIVAQYAAPAKIELKSNFQRAYLAERAAWNNQELSAETAALPKSFLMANIPMIAVQAERQDSGLWNLKISRHGEIHLGDRSVRGVAGGRIFCPKIKEQASLLESLGFKFEKEDDLFGFQAYVKNDLKTEEVFEEFDNLNRVFDEHDIQNLKNSDYSWPTPDDLYYVHVSKAKKMYQKSLTPPPLPQNTP